MSESGSASRIRVLVVATAPDLKAEVIAARVAVRSDMVLVNARYVSPDEVDGLLAELPVSAPSAMVVVGHPAETDALAQHWLGERADLVVMLVDIADDTVRIALRDPRLDSLLSALRGLVDRIGTDGEQRVVHIALQSLPPSEILRAAPEADATGAPVRPLLAASRQWVHRLLRDAAERVPDENGDVTGLSVTRATLLQSLDAPDREVTERPDDLTAASAALDRALVESEAQTEPLALLYRTCDLSALEFRMLVLGLAPELDLRYQRCLGFLLDEMSRRVGTVGLFSTLLGPGVEVRRQLSEHGALDRWLIFEQGQQVSADEPLRIDPFLARWLLGDADALAADPRVRRVLRLVPWAGAGLLDRYEERTRAALLIDRLQDPAAAPWLLLDGDDPAGWRALLERGAIDQRVVAVRADVSRLAGADLLDVEACARCLGRMARLSNGVLLLDVTRADTDSDDYWLRVFFATVTRTGCHAAVIARHEAPIVRVIGTGRFDLLHEEALSPPARLAATQAAAAASDAHLTAEAAAALASQYPLSIDALDHASSLARSRPLDYSADEPRIARFTTAAREVAAEGLSHLADLIDPAFSLDDVVLPADRKQQLTEIVDNVRLAGRVLDEWKFRDQLPYGRGVTALFFGPSGTGKTMAAIGIAERLGVQLLRLDLSRVVSKYIGDTEKNIDRVFSDAERSGAAILIDEADALLGKRSEVKDAHDRYANIEVAFLLQRMESYRGLAILTTNMRQSLDPAFVRRLRFMIDFPRPDAQARESIWRLCLPEGTHTLDEAAFRLLARRIDLTGGHIRQISLRAAFIAAAADTFITLPHIAQAARAELAKLGMPAVDLDTGSGRQAA